MDLWHTSPVITKGRTSFIFNDSYLNDICVLTSEDENTLIATLNGATKFVAHITGGNVSDSFDWDLNYIISFNVENNLLLPFDLIEGSDVYTFDSFKDSATFLFEKEGYITTMEEWAGISCKNRVDRTTQTITVSK